MAYAALSSELDFDGQLASNSAATVPSDKSATA